MGIPNLVAFLDRHHKPQHIKISADEERFPQPGQWSSANLPYRKVLTDLWEAVQSIVCCCIQSHSVSLLRQGLGEAHTLPFAASFDQQFVNNQRDVHRNENGSRKGYFRCFQRRPAAAPLAEKDSTVLGNVIGPVGNVRASPLICYDLQRRASAGLNDRDDFALRKKIHWYWVKAQFPI